MRLVYIQSLSIVSAFRSGQDTHSLLTLLGTTLTSPTVYISYNVLYAADSCSAAGKTYRNTILPLQNTNHLFSLVTFLWEDMGYATFSFDFSDLIEPIPTSVYDRQSRCQLSSIIYYLFSTPSQYTTSYSCDRTEPYAPIIAVPPEVQSLDPAWKSCGAWYGGLFDPPKALQPADTIVKPTLPADPTPLATSPQPTVDSDQAARTPAPVTTSLESHTTHNHNEFDGTRVYSTSDPAEPIDGSGSNTPDVEQTVKRVTNDRLEPAKPQSSAHLLQEQSSGAAAILSAFLTQVSRSSGIADVSPLKKPASDQDVPDQTYTASAAISGVSSSEVVSTATSTDQAAASAIGESLQLSSMPKSSTSSADVSQGVAAILSMSTAQNDVSTGALEDFSTSSDPVSHAEGSADGIDPMPPADPAVQNQHSTVFTINEHTYSVAGNSGSPLINGVHVPISETVTTNGDAFIIGSNVIDYQGTKTSLYNGDPGISTATLHDNTALSSHALTVGGTVYEASTIPNQPDAVPLAGHTNFEGGAAATIDGQVITHGRNGISVLEPAGRTATDTAVSHTQTLVTVDGSAYTATQIPGRSDAVMLQGQTFSMNAEGTPVADRLASKSSTAISVGDATSSLPSSAFGSPSSTEAAESSAVQRDPPSQLGESAACKRNHVFLELLLTTFWMMFRCL